MPKLKTKSGAKKRFGRTATGKIKMNHGHKRHRLISKPKQMKRKARGTTTLQKGDAKLVLRQLLEALGSVDGAQLAGRSSMRALLIMEMPSGEASQPAPTRV